MPKAVLIFQTFLLRNARRKFLYFVIQLNQLSKIKKYVRVNTVIFMNYDLLELEIPDSYKKTYGDCFFPFLLTLFSSTVVPKVQNQLPLFC